MDEALKQRAAASYLQLIEVIEQLRGENGCPWDKEQTHQSLKKCLIEECYEVIDAIEREDTPGLCDELGDLILQVVFHAQLKAEEDQFTMADVTDGINAKMIRRHPHVFGSDSAEDSAAVLTKWEEIKAAEKAAGTKERRGIMKLNDNLPALMLAQKVQDKAHRVGFDWPDISGPRAKVDEELAELMQAETPEQRAEELGDLLFAVVNMSRFMGVDAEEAMRLSVRKFVRRFNYVEEQLAEQGKQPAESTLEEMDALWDKAKTLGL